MFFYRLKNFICVLLAVIFCLLFAVGVKAAGVTRLIGIEGKRMYFLDSASSQGLQKETLTVGELARVKGESVSTLKSTYEGGRYALNEDLARDIAARYGATILFTERVGDCISYYAYTEKWQDGLSINGVKVNLHIALDCERLTVGTPIIFGGF